MDTRIPAPIRDLLTDYLQSLATELPGLVDGLYLHGSVALNAFNKDLSDIDFVAFLTRRATAADLDRLRAIHQSMKTKYPRWMLEGTYLQWDDLGRLEDSVAPSPIYHDGKLEANGNFDVNSVTWWVLKYRGIGLIGPLPHELPLEVDWDLLVSKMRENLNSYWASYIRKPQRIAWLLTDYGIQWTVLGVLRQYYTFVAHDITSKSGAGEYALDQLPAQWHRLIREAIRIRQRKPPSLYHSKLKRAAEAYNFLHYIINYCNSLPV